MAWKKDLAKLKQTLEKEEDPPAKAAPPPKAKPAAPASGSMEEEDKVFLAAMGVRAKRPSPAPLREEPITALTAPPPAGGGEFSAAMGDLKGIKPLPPGPGPARAGPGTGSRGGRSAPPGDGSGAPGGPEPGRPSPGSGPGRRAGTGQPRPGPPAPAVPPRCRSTWPPGWPSWWTAAWTSRATPGGTRRSVSRNASWTAMPWAGARSTWCLGSSPELRQMVLDLLSPAGALRGPVRPGSGAHGRDPGLDSLFPCSRHPEN